MMAAPAEEHAIDLAVSCLFSLCSNREEYPQRRGSPRYDDPYYDGPHSRGGSPEPKPSGPMTFKQFLMNQQDDPSPEEAQERYKAYLVDYHGGEIKAEFAATREKDR